MGKSNSKTALKRKELEHLVNVTHFDHSEVKALFDHYKSISGSVNKDGVIDKSEFVQALKLRADSVLTDRLFALFDGNGDTVINFREFLCGLSVFSNKGTFEEKLKFSFQLYDLDNDGSIDKSEMMQMLGACLVQNPLNLSQAQIEQLVDSTFAEADSDGDGRISFDEYRTMVNKHPSLLNSMTLSSPLEMGDDEQQ